MKNISFSNEQWHERDLRTLENYRPMDDDFMRELFRDDLPLAQLVLRIITGIDDLKLTEQQTQYDMKRLLGSRSICLDVFGTDSQGRKFDLEIQRADRGLHHKEQDTIQVQWMLNFSKRKKNSQNFRLHTLFSLLKTMFVVRIS